MLQIHRKFMSESISESKIWPFILFDVHTATHLRPVVHFNKMSARHHSPLRDRQYGRPNFSPTYVSTYVSAPQFKESMYIVRIRIHIQ